MEHLTGINIRTGLEKLNISISEIFKNKTEAIGDLKIKELYQEDCKDIFNEYPDLEMEFEESPRVFYNDKKIIHKIDDSLSAYVFDSYELNLDYHNNNKPYISKNTEIEFVNSVSLDFDQFCFNIMSAQAFSGKYPDPLYLYHFIGLGKFNLEDYASIHQMAMHSNCNLIYFFIYYKNVISGIYHFTSANYDKDIKDQKEFLTDKEYRSIMRTFKTHRRLYEQNLRNIAIFDDDGFRPDISDINDGDDEGE